MTVTAAETLNTIRSFESAHPREWSFDAIRAVVGVFAAQPLAVRRDVLAGMGYRGVNSMSGKACNEKLSSRLTERLGSWQRMEGVRPASVGA